MENSVQSYAANELKTQRRPVAYRYGIRLNFFERAIRLYEQPRETAISLNTNVIDTSPDRRYCSRKRKRVFHISYTELGGYKRGIVAAVVTVCP